MEGSHTRGLHQRASRRRRSFVFTHLIYLKELPLELRWRIWEATLTGPRLVHVYCLEEQIHNKEHMDIVNSPPPVAHAVNKESRDFVLREYQRVPILMDSREKNYGSLLFSPKIDTLHMSWESCLRFIDPGWGYVLPTTTFPLTPCSDDIKTFLGSIQRLELSDFRERSLDQYEFEEFLKYFQLLSYLRSVEDVKLVDCLRDYSGGSQWYACIDYISQTLHSLYVGGSITRMPTITTWQITTPPHYPKFEQLPRPVYVRPGTMETHRYVSIVQATSERWPVTANDQDVSDEVHEGESSEQQQKNPEQDNDQEENRLAPERKDLS